jgi:hypothetical protein
MFYWGWWIGPLIAVVLALRLRPIHLAVLALSTMVGFYVSFSISESLYSECEPCPRTEHVLVWVNSILITATPALLVLAVLKGAFRALSDSAKSS